MGGTNKGEEEEEEDGALLSALFAVVEVGRG